jgi:hypothetical protein
MTLARSLEVLMKGLKAAGERMLSERVMNRPEYKRGFQKLYDNAENELFNVYNAIENKKYKTIRESAGDLIITMSKIVEYAEMRIRIEETKWTLKQELDKEDSDR